MAVIEQEVMVLIEVGDHPAVLHDEEDVVILPIGSSDVRLSIGRTDLKRWLQELNRAIDGPSG